MQNLDINKEDMLFAMTDELQLAILDISVATQQLVAEAEGLSAIGDALFQVFKVLLDEVPETDAVLNIMNKISGETKLLGLNASIEMIRVGGKEKGFGVVVEEVRKLAEHSNSSLKQIEAILNTLIDRSGQIQQIQQINLQETRRQV